jgi:hypothetical protein
VNDISSFYTRDSIEDALEFLARYDVDYVIVGQLERQYYEFFKPCWPDTLGQGVICDLHGRAIGLQDPDVHPSDCEPVNGQDEEEKLICPTFGLDKFESMVREGQLKKVYQEGATTIYEVVK